MSYFRLLRETSTGNSFNWNNLFIFVSKTNLDFSVRIENSFISRWEGISSYFYSPAVSLQLH